MRNKTKMPVLPSTQRETTPPVLVVEDDVLTRIAFSVMLDTAGFRTLPVGTAEDALEVLTCTPIQAVVTDVNLSPGGISGIELAHQVCDRWGVGVVVVSGHITPGVDKLPPGVHFLAKPVHRATLVHLVRDATLQATQPTQLRPQDITIKPRTSTALTPRQHDVLELLVQGKNNQHIAEALGLSEHTVRVHLVAIFRALGVSSRAGAVVSGIQHLRAQTAHQGPPLT